MTVYNNSQTYLIKLFFHGASVSSVAQSCSTLWDPTDCSTPGFPVHHQLELSVGTEVSQTHSGNKYYVLIELKEKQ